MRNKGTVICGRSSLAKRRLNELTPIAPNMEGAVAKCEISQIVVAESRRVRLKVVPSFKCGTDHRIMVSGIPHHASRPSEIEAVVLVEKPSSTGRIGWR